MEAAAVGREYQHIEDLLIVDGAEGGLEAADELLDAVQNSGSMDFKWDGGASVYWGRDDSGRFIFAPKNQWMKGQQVDKKGLYGEIMNTGRKPRDMDDEQFKSIRKGMADEYARLWDIFEEATPSAFRGFMNGDLMFTKKQQPGEDGNYRFTPNKVMYTVKPDGLYGKMKTAEAFVVVHGMIEEFGADASNIKMVPDNVMDAFNRSNRVIMLNTQHPHQSLQNVDTSDIRKAKQFIEAHQQEIDEIANFSAPKFTTLKKIMYDYAVKRSKSNGQLDFASWLESSKVSANQKQVLAELMQNSSWDIFWKAFDMLINAKHDVLEHLFDQGEEHMGNNLGMTASIGDARGGEGLVKKRRGGGYSKFVNPRFRSGELNARFQ